MRYVDKVYGQVKIAKPIILELINNASLQRLKGIDQGGYRPLWVKPEIKMGKYDHSRFAHSLGVYILLKKYNASLEEQVAGLIHDVSHSTFSHCVDYALVEGSPKTQNHQDNIFKEFVYQTEIPKILDKHGFDIDYILDEKNFPLKEKELPDLCADRLDYSLRTAFLFKEASKQFINNLLDNLSVEENNWVFKNFSSAKAYAQLFLKLNQVYYAGFASALMFQTVGDFLKQALKRRYINKKDLYTTDQQVINKATKYLKQDKKLFILWQRMNGKIKAINSVGDFDVHVFVKSRIVDPLFKKDHKIIRLSNSWPEWQETVAKESIPKEYFIKFER